jgi:hypothetical protein
MKCGRSKNHCFVVRKRAYVFQVDETVVELEYAVLEPLVVEPAIEHASVQSRRAALQRRHLLGPLAETRPRTSVTSRLFRSFVARARQRGGKNN